jgi:uncharacterized protein YeaO (DUF488 family)
MAFGVVTRSGGRRARLAKVAFTLSRRETAGEGKLPVSLSPNHGRSSGQRARWAVFKLKRAYESPHPSDGLRVLVERLWPRRLTKGEVALGLWMKEVAPSPELRRWFGHAPGKFEAFRRCYRQELAEKRDLLDELGRRGARGTVTLVYAARDEEHNGAVVLKGVLEEAGLGRRSKRRGRGPAAVVSPSSPTAKRPR